MNNVKQNLYRIRKEIYEEYYRWYVSENLIVSLKTLCPPNMFDTCSAENGTSWDGTTRNTNYMCTPETSFTYMPCPNTKCWNGAVPSKIDCSCDLDSSWESVVIEEEV